MSEIPAELSGALTVALIVVLGVFVYPALLARRRGRLVVVIATTLLAALFVVFDRASGLSAGRSVAVGLAIALAPVLTGAIVARLQRGKSS